MNPEHWQQIDKLFDAALEREPEERVAFLEEACPGDVALRNQVEALLAAHEKVGSFIERPAMEVEARGIAGDQGREEGLATGETVSHYRIISSLGSGGMGDVYLAQDTVLGRQVALKLLPQDFTSDHNRLRRFQLEARAASALNHPNIITIYEIGLVGDRHFIATEFIDGATLRQNFFGEGTNTSGSPLRLREVMDIAMQTADALAAAHEASIVHRDIKPENIMVRRRDGYVKVLDFGLAKLTEAEVDCEGPTRAQVKTNPGVVMGTVNYMSPEQARGEQVDPRTDIWSLGVVVYELVAGCAPFERPTQNEVLASILGTKPPPPLARYSREVPAELERIVIKALSKDREARYQTAKDLLIDLRRFRQRLEVEAEIERTAELREESNEGNAVATDGEQKVAVTSRVATLETRDAAVAHSTSLLREITLHRRGALIALAAVVVVMAVAAYFANLRYWSEGGRAANVGSTAGIRSIAVLPFANTSKDPETEYLSDGISESLINSLSQLPNVKVISFSSVMQYKGQQIDPQAVGTALQVRAVLMSRIVKNDNAISISAELVDVQDKSHLWGKRYERKLSDLITLRGEIAKDVSEELRLRLSGDEQERLTKTYTNNTEAYHFYLKGRYFSAKQTEEEIRKGIEYFNQAINVDPNYALAYAGLSSAYYQLSQMYLPSKEAMPKAKAAALRALELDNYLSEAHASLAMVKTFYEWDWSGAEKEYQQAIALNPNYASAHEFYGWHLALVGQPDKSISELERAQELDPLTAEVGWSLGVSLFFARRYDNAITQLLKTLEMDPKMPLAHWHLAASYEQQGRFNEAIAEFQKAAELMGGSRSSTLDDVGHAYALLGKRSEAIKILNELKGPSRDRVSGYGMAIIYTGLGEKDQALASLEKAYEDRSEFMTWIKVDPRLDSLRSDERFTKLMRRVGLNP